MAVDTTACSVIMSEPTDKPLVWSTYSDTHAGWCVWKQDHVGGVTAKMVAGPFRTRQEADDLLGPLLGQLDAPNHGIEVTAR